MLEVAGVVVTDSAGCFVWAQFDVGINLVTVSQRSQPASYALLEEGMKTVGMEDLQGALVWREELGTTGLGYNLLLGQHILPAQRKECLGYFNLMEDTTMLEGRGILHTTPATQVSYLGWVNNTQLIIIQIRDWNWRGGTEWR